MSEMAIFEDEEGVLALQRSLANLAFLADPTLMEQDPVAFARQQGLPAPDQRAFLHFRDRLLAYRGFIRSNLAEPVEDTFPVTIAHLKREGVWNRCFNLFLEARPVQSMFHRDIAPTFLGWLDSTGWGQDRWPFLVALAHCEILGELVVRHPGGDVPHGLRTVARPQDRLVLDPATQVVAYPFAVHLCTEDNPIPEPEAVHLLVYRDTQGWAAWRCLTPATAALLMEGQTRSIATALQTLGFPEPSGALGLLDELCAQGAIRGFMR
jgi:hypothetical protein